MKENRKSNLVHVSTICTIASFVSGFASMFVITFVNDLKAQVALQLNDTCSAHGASFEISNSRH